MLKVKPAAVSESVGRKLCAFEPNSGQWNASRSAALGAIHGRAPLVRARKKSRQSTLNRRIAGNNRLLTKNKKQQTAWQRQSQEF